MAQSPQDWARKLQQTLQQQRGGKGGFGGGGPPRGSLGVGAGIAILVGGALVVNNALFNGMHGYPFPYKAR